MLQRQRIRSVKSSFQTHGGGPSRKPPPRLAHMNLNGAPRKTTTYKERERNAAIDRENRRLHGNLNNIYTAPPGKSFVKEMALDTNTRIAAGLEGDGPSLVEKGRAARRQQELLEVILQNQAIHGRLSSVQAVMDRRDFHKHADRHEEVVRRRAKMPFVLRDEDNEEEEEDEYVAYIEAQRSPPQQRQQQRYEQPQRRARSTMEMSQSRDITGISALDEETSHLQKSRGRGAGRGGRRSQSQNSWNEGPAERARRELEGESGGREYHYNDHGSGDRAEDVIDDEVSYTVDDRGREADRSLDESLDSDAAAMVVEEEGVEAVQ
jgi:hypothetical protein